MATRADVVKRVTLVNVDWVESSKEAEKINSGMRLIFSSERGSTLLGSLQGEHATAYAMYVEFAMVIVGRYIASGLGNSYSGISDLVKALKFRVGQDNYLLHKFSLPQNDTEFFDKLDDEIRHIQKKFNIRIRALLENIAPMEELKKLITLASLPLEAVKEIQKLKPESLKTEVINIRAEYFFKVAKKIAEEYLLFQNKSLHVAFQKVPGYEADSGEGARIAAALAWLREYKEMAKEEARPRARSVSVAAAKIKTINVIVDNMSKLLFYPKIDESSVELKPKDLAKRIVRSNDPNVFAFVVTRHLSIIFATFEELAKNEILKGQITEKFVLKMAQDGGFTVVATEGFKQRITEALDELENGAVYKEDLNLSANFSVGGLQSPGGLSFGSPGLTSAGVGLTPKYHQQTEAASFPKPPEPKGEEEEEKVATPDRRLSAPKQNRS